MISVSSFFGTDLDRAVSGVILLLLLGVVSFQFLLKRNKRRNELLDSSQTPVVEHASTSGWLPEENFDVFINHRGPDVKTGFVKKLDESLRTDGIRPFLDAHDINSGQESWDSIIKAIRGAPVCICVFSPGYAESKWCLDELALILDLRSDKLVLPVFYNVKPMHLRRPDVGHLSKGLEKVSKRYGPKAAARWRAALDKAADLFGEELDTNSSDDPEHNFRLEASTVHKLVKSVHQRLKVLFPVTIDQRASHIVQFLENHSDKACTMGIWGMGGIGKTTLVSEIFKRMKDDFDGASFLEDVAKIVTNKDGGLEALQTQLLFDLSGNKEVKVVDVDEGKILLKRCLQSKRVLIVVDNVEDEAVRDALCIDEYLGTGSCCLVTSRSLEACSAFKTNYNYEVELLKSIDAKQLFCWHAFDSIFPRQGFEELAYKISSACGGLPLALETIGSLLKGIKDVRIWEEVLLNLQRHEALEYNDKLFHQLKLSFNSLEAREKDMFLDVACFLLGTEKTIAIEIWESSGWSVRLGLRNLERKCLLKVENNCLTMHDLLIDMGHKIVTMESRIDLGERSRLWMFDSEQAILANQTTKNVVAFSFAGSKFPLWNLDFKTMKNLRLLNLDECSAGGAVELPQLLRYIRWHRMPTSELPPGVYDMRWLAVLDLTSSNMKILWHPNSDVTFPELRALILVGCTALKELPNSIARSRHLRNLNLSGCSSLDVIPDDIGCLNELEILNLQGCLKLVNFPESMGGLTSLTELNLRNCSNLVSLPESIGSCVMLRSLSLMGCLSLVNLPRSVGKLCNLEYLLTSDCSHLTGFPDSMKELSKLKALFIGGGELRAVPLFIEYLAGTLEELHIYNSKIETVPEFVFKLTKLQVMRIGGCQLFHNITDNIGGLKDLRDLNFVGCSGLKRLPDPTSDLTNLEELGLQGCQQLENLPKTLGQLKNLQVLKLNGCMGLVELPDAESISNLSTSCRQKICEFIQFRCEQNIMRGKYDAAEQDVNYIMMLRPGDPTFQKLHKQIDENKSKTSEALLSTDLEGLRRKAWQKVELNDMREAAAFIDRMVEVDSESEFALLCRTTLRFLVDDTKGSEADQELLKTVRAKRRQAGEELPQLYVDSLKKWNRFMSKLDARGALLEILKVDGSEEGAQSVVPLNGKAVSLPGKEELAASAWKPQPGKAAALREQAQTMIGLGAYFGALVHLDAADKLDPDNVSTLHARGYAKQMASDCSGAYRDYNRVLVLDPNHVETLVSRATMRQAFHPYDLDGALVDCEKAVAVCVEGTRNCSIALQTRGLVKCKMGDFDGAFADLDLSYQMRADANTLQFKEGLLKWKLGDYEAALEDLGLAYVLLPDDSPLRYKQKVEVQ